MNESFKLETTAFTWNGYLYSRYKDVCHKSETIDVQQVPFQFKMPELKHIDEAEFKKAYNEYNMAQTRKMEKMKFEEATKALSAKKEEDLLKKILIEANPKLKETDFE